MTTPVFGISGFKNSGKTTLTARLIEAFSQRGLSVSSIKHAHHEFDLDQAGTDTDKHRKAGASQVVIASQKRWAVMTEIGDSDVEPTLDELISQIAPCDLILVEGYKNEGHPKLLLIANDEHAQLIARIKNVTAIASETGIDVSSELPRYDRNDISGLVMHIATTLNLSLNGESR